MKVTTLFFIIGACLSTIFLASKMVYSFGAWCPADEYYTGGPECAGCHLAPVSCYYYYWFCVEPGPDGDCTNCHVVGGTGPPVEDFTDCTMAPFLTVTTIAGPIGTISPSGSFEVSPNSDVTLTITPTSGYQVEDVQITKDFWHNGESVGPVRSYTLPNITQNHIIEATFVALPPCSGDPVLVGALTYPDLQSAYDAIALGGAEVLKMQSTDFGEDLILDRDVTVILKGGYDCDFPEPPVSFSAIRSMTINNGTVGTENIILK